MFAGTRPGLGAGSCRERRDACGAEVRRTDAHRLSPPASAGSFVAETAVEYLDTGVVGRLAGLGKSMRARRLWRRVLADDSVEVIPESRQAGPAFGRPDDRPHGKPESRRTFPRRISRPVPRFASLFLRTRMTTRLIEMNHHNRDRNDSPRRPSRICRRNSVRGIRVLSPICRSTDVPPRGCGGTSVND